MKRILVCCSAGQSTSLMVETCLRELLEKNHIEAEIKRCTVQDVYGYLSDFEWDLVVPNCAIDSRGVPCVSGLPYVIGFGAEKTDRAILDVLTK